MRKPQETIMAVPKHRESLTLALSCQIRALNSEIYIDGGANETDSRTEDANQLQIIREVKMETHWQDKQETKNAANGASIRQILKRLDKLEEQNTRDGVFQDMAIGNLELKLQKRIAFLERQVNQLQKEVQNNEQR